MVSVLLPNQSKSRFFTTFTLLYKLKKILVRISKSYALDPRALSLMRIGIALVIIADLLIRGSDLTAHYTDEGMWPTRVVENFGWKAGFWSLHGLSGTYAWVLCLFILHFIFALFLLFGYKTKLSTFILWLLHISLLNRNLYINQVGDDVLRLILFWGLFLPWNSFYAIDSKKILSKPKQKTLANLGYLLLIFSVYFFTVSLKTSAEWRLDNSAIYYALSLEQLRLPGVGDWLYQFPALMKILTWLVFYIELIIPILVIVPGKKAYLRLIAFLLIMMLHTGIGLTLYVGLFFVINMVSAIGLLPAFAMDKLENKFKLLKHSVKKVYQKQKQRVLLKGVTNVICIVVIVFCFAINLSSVSWFRYELKPEIMYPVNVLRFDQYWGMFSPSILKRDGWYVYYGMDSVGRQWDMIRNEDYVNFEKPKSIFKIHKTDRWRKITENMQREDMYFMRPLFCKYKLRRWNKNHPEKKLHSLTLYYMQKETLPNYKTTEVKKQMYCVCNDN